MTIDLPLVHSQDSEAHLQVTAGIGDLLHRSSACLDQTVFLGWVLVLFSVVILAPLLEGGGPNRSQRHGRHACPEALISHGC